MVDAPASGAGDRKVVEVRVLSWAPFVPKLLFRLEISENVGLFTSDCYKCSMERAKMCSYLHRRSGVYCTRMVVPPRLRIIIGKSDLGRSLRTKELAEAKRLLPSWLQEAQASLAAAEKELACGSTRPAQAHTAQSHALTQQQADWEEEDDNFWQGVEREDEAKAEAEDALLAKLDGPESELTQEQGAAARLIKDMGRDRDRYRNRYRARKQRDEANTAFASPGRTEPAGLS